MGVGREAGWGTLGAWILTINRSQDQGPVPQQQHPAKCTEGASWGRFCILDKW